MRRIHLFELEDQPWLPHVLRNSLTDLLRAVVEPAASGAPTRSHLRRLLDAGRTDTFVDLCSGSAGPMLAMRRAMEADLGRPVRLVLTDKYPNLSAFEAAAAEEMDRVTYCPNSVDALAVPPDLRGVRTLFDALHHFRPDAVREILSDAVRTRTPIAAFDGLDRSALALLSIAVSPLFVFLGTPFLRPYRPSRLLFTYVIPLIPLLALWDGFVSCLRTYSPDELRALVNDVPAEDWTWEVGRVSVPLLPWRVAYVLGYPSN